ncbi:Glyco transf 10 domain containing protein [Trichuris trichiura]|uniref:Fucosyltransferase n=1 Tax=Trichuris trichiura TaxID=36087 RepID=A0A077ZKA4_TRITR|nr:Glyco transf 10 domain containing protein [Trichuris trichiura]
MKIEPANVLLNHAAISFVNNRNTPASHLHGANVNGDVYEKKKPLLILMWEDYSDAHISNEYLKYCSALNCRITFDRLLINESSAIVHYDRTLNPSDLPPRKRLPHQHYVFFLMESAHYVSKRAFRMLQKDYYTLTMTFRRDSDIFCPFGYLKLRNPSLKTPLSVWTSIASSKPKKVVWVVSFCNSISQREVYVAELKKYLDVDTYGYCGSLKCPKIAIASMQHSSCEETFKKNYKFYIAFENSACKDFVTEKIFNRVESHMVPIVMKRSFYEPLLPKGSFIAADDFKSPKELAKYIDYLNGNLTAYIEYYKWKDNYEAVPFPGGFHIGMCQLCGRLRADTGVGAVYPSESATDIDKWYKGRSEWGLVCCLPTGSSGGNFKAGHVTITTSPEQ